MDEQTRQLTQAREREAATREILRVINRSPGDYQPVFETILESATRLCGAQLGYLLIREGDELRFVAERGSTPEANEYFFSHPMPLDPEHSITARAAVEGRPVHVPDIAQSPVSGAGQAHRRVGLGAMGIRTQLAVPMMHGEGCIGVIVIYRRKVRAFEPDHVDLVSMFAEQAVIAIENVRQFKALQERTGALTRSLERQTASSEVLRAISQSPEDDAPVFEIILASATRLCEAPLSSLYLLENDRFRCVSVHGGRPTFVEFLSQASIPVDEDTVIGRAAIARVAVQVADIVADAGTGNRNPLRVASMEVEGIRTLLAVPLLRGGDVIGAIALYRREVMPFDEDHIELVETFADQAVVAIENARLFHALQERTGALTHALERQTATSEVLRVISRSPTDYQPVIDAILEHAGRICHAQFGSLLLVRDGLAHSVAWMGGQPEFRKIMEEHPASLHGDSQIARAARTGSATQIEGLNDSFYRSGSPRRIAAVEIEGIRTLLVVPMMKGDEAVGFIALFRREERRFDASDIAVLETFADQAVIAIDNARGFQALESRTAELGEALERQTATAEILRAISRSPTDYQPVFDAILANASRLCESPFGILYLVRPHGLEAVAILGGNPEWIEHLGSTPTPLDPEQSITARAAYEGRPLRCEDIAEEAAYRSGQPNRTAAVDLGGVRSLLAVPLMKDGKGIGVICIYRHEVRAFEDKHVELLTTFADQAVIAIDNVRLFQAVEARTAELTRSVGELRALGEVGRAVSASIDLETVLTTIIEHAVELSGADGGAISELDEATGTLPMRAAPGFTEMLAGERPLELGEGVIGRAAAERSPVQVPDTDAPGAYTGPLRHVLEEAGLRALLAVPLLREDRVLGTLLVARRTPGEFPPETVELLGTFAAQSALAIHNARLFGELQDKGRELEAANRHKSEFLANMSHELRTPLNAVIGFSEVLGEEMFGELNEKQAEYVEDIHGSGRHLLSLINDILDLSKVEAGQMELDLSTFEVASALENALTLVRERASRRGVELDAEIEAGLGEMIGDERKLKQILLNLLSNAIKFTEPGGRVSLGARRDGASLSIEVSDTGIGISPDDQTLVFEAFRQAGGDYARKTEGTGLGLTLTRRFVEMHGGEIALESKPGEGSTFTVRLPVAPGGACRSSEATSQGAER